MTITDPRHVINTEQFFDRQILTELFDSAREMKQQVQNRRVQPLLRGLTSANLFFEPSTRTRLSFESAMQMLGGQIISSESAGQFSSALKGESLEDSIQVVSGYVDLIVLRHPEAGSAERAAAVSSVPLINAGDGGRDHPTQALLDIFTIQEEFGHVEGLKVALVGDLLHSRTIHSLLLLLGLFKPELILISPEQLPLPDQYYQYLDVNRIKYSELDSLDALSQNIDLIYMNRIQKERFHDPNEYELLKHSYIFGSNNLKQLKPEARIMNPLPRVGEIDPLVDHDPRAAYFRQAQNGLYVRMALLAHILG